jgi:hypothetical protein
VALAVLGVLFVLPIVAAAQEAVPPEGSSPCEGGQHCPDGRIRRINSPDWVGDGIHNIDSLGQTRAAVIPAGATARFAVRFDNDGTETDTFVIQGSRNPRHFLISYFVNGAPVSSHVRNGSYRFEDVPSGGFRTMTVEVRARNTAPVGSKAITRIGVRSALEAGLLDRVKAVTYRSQGIETRIEGRTFTNVATAERWARSKGASPRFVSNAALYFELAPTRGIRPEIAYAQSAKETGYGNFGGVIDASWNNPCGLKTTAGGGNGDPDAHQRFANWRQGVTACIDHLALYAGAPGYPRASTPDPRHFESIYATAPTVERLGGHWAPDSDYGRSIVRDLLIPLLGS